jgi:hypothetical protein
MFSQEETRIEKLRELCQRWNVAASGVGICGSEYVDDPERVFEAVRSSREILTQALLRARRNQKGNTGS